MRVVAGANGAGKTFLTRTALAEINAGTTTIVDPDAIARVQNLGAIAAGRETTRIIAARLHEGADLLVETTLAGSNGLRLMRTAAAHGYTVLLYYVGTGNVAINVQRIAKRVARGGHHVPTEDVMRRYGRSLTNLLDAIAYADEFVIFDNSSDRLGPVAIAVGHGGAGEVECLTTPPGWVVEALGARLRPLT